MIKSSFRLPLLGLAVLIVAGTLLASREAGRWRGNLVSRGSTEPVFISRSGGAGAEVQVAPESPSVITGPTLVTTTASSVTIDLCSLPRVTPAEITTRPELEVEAEELRKMVPFEDAAAQPALGPAASGPSLPAAIQNFDGLNFNAWGSGFPPDTNGDVGTNHYIQTVNTAVGIYSKTGTELCAFTFDAMFGNATVPTGTPCDANNNGDPVALYDAAADRWIVTDFAWTNNDNGPYYECIAASKTNNPVTGGWWLYALRADDAAHPWLNDYPKLGVWPDGIYMAANMYDCTSNCGGGTSYEGSRAWALNRADLYSGAPLRAVVFDVDTNAFTMLPSNFRGAAPPAGTPNYFVANDLSFFRLNTYEFDVDWAAPASSTFTGPTQIPVASYSSPPDTIPVLSGNDLDSLGSRLMMQNQYRNIGSVEFAVAVAHRRQGLAQHRRPALVPDQRHRRRGQHHAGAAKHLPARQQAPLDAQPGRGPGRQHGHRLQRQRRHPVRRHQLHRPPCRRSAEYAVPGPRSLLIAGGGAQNNSCGGPCERWGDYSTMTVDPVDDCTFWYTTEYYAASGSDWHTRIGSFKFPSCGVVFTDFVYLPAVILQQPPRHPPAWTNLMQEGFEGAWPSAGWQVVEF